VRTLGSFARRDCRCLPPRGWAATIRRPRSRAAAAGCPQVAQVGIAAAVPDAPRRRRTRSLAEANGGLGRGPQRTHVGRSPRVRLKPRILPLSRRDELLAAIAKASWRVRIAPVAAKTMRTGYLRHATAAGLRRVALGTSVPWGIAQRTLAPGCQWPSVSPQLRPSVLPTGGHVFSPLVATNLPTVMTREPGQVRGVTPLPAVA
jgi:hypothetical protein